jgi:anti-sigma regulatory factor (Ser/Thr protein kinase)
MGQDTMFSLNDGAGPEEQAHVLQRARYLVQEDRADMSSVRRSEHRFTIDSDPACIPSVISLIMHTTASTVPETQRQRLRGALHELLLNAVEHGNLELSHQNHQKVLEQDGYEKLLGQHLARSRFKGRQVVVHVLYDRGTKSLIYRIADEGKGFNWRNVLNRSHDACSCEDINGRGIFLAQSFFPSLLYNDRGNEVTIRVPLA